MLDRTGRRSKWAAARSAENSYNARLRQVARQVGLIVSGIAPDGEVSDAQEREIRYSMERYSALLRPWAKSVANHMIADVDRRNERAWWAVAKDLGRSIALEIKHAPTGMVYEALMEDQVELITSLPTKAGKRVHDLVTESITSSRRASEIAKDILATGRVTEARATLIARTEVSRASSNFTQARAMYAGSEGYIWRSSEDGDVRDTHKKVNGKFFRWDEPPKTDPNLDPYHPGCGPNCRCYPEPVIPEYTE